VAYPRVPEIIVAPLRESWLPRGNGRRGEAAG